MVLLLGERAFFCDGGVVSYCITDTDLFATQC